MQNGWRIPQGQHEGTGPLRLGREAAPTGTFTNIALGSATSTFFLTANLMLTAELPSIGVLINSLGPNYSVTKPFLITVHQIDDAFVASFLEANVHASGDTVDEAASNLISLLTDVFEEYLLLGIETLGPGPLQEFNVMRSYIRKN